MEVLVPAGNTQLRLEDKQRGPLVSSPSHLTAAINPRSYLRPFSIQLLGFYSILISLTEPTQLDVRRRSEKTRVSLVLLYHGDFFIDKVRHVTDVWGGPNTQS